MLQNYLLGPNITYSVVASSDDVAPVAYILQNNQSNLHWDKSPGFTPITSFYMETIGDLIIMYVQDDQKLFYIAFC